MPRSSPSRGGRGRRRAWALAACVSVGLAGTGLVGSAGAGTLTYAALGDSYTSGPFIPVQQQPYGCLRSDHNYPSLVAADLGAQLTDVSCAGATTDHMTQSQGVTPGPANPPQFSALNATTQIVTIGIGGNDIHFSSIANNCYSATPTGHPCQDKYGATATSGDIIDQWIQAAAPKVAQALQGIHTQAPSARLYVVGYPAIFPEQPLVSGAPEGCWPSLPVAPEDVPYLRAKEKALNAMLASQVAASAATYPNTFFVDTYTPSIGHDACQPPVVRWVEPAVPASPAAPVHPNLFGMEAMAGIVKTAITG
ncbi:MAG: SGNH/GDSL hydrolase family protein [Actinobacteria bacterium]|nr:MAG: SGNH/GDSL hydrolase family protein [Actinomycetota bacterium]